MYVSPFPVTESLVYFLFISVTVLSILQGGKSYWYLLRDIYEDLMKQLVELSSTENILSLQPCRDNTLYLMKLIDEMLISELDNKLPVWPYLCRPLISCSWINIIVQFYLHTVLQ